MRDIEDYLRTNIHSALIDGIVQTNPYKNPVKDIKKLLRVDNLLLFDSIINIKNEVTKSFDENFYNINVLNMFDMETYE